MTLAAIIAVCPGLIAVEEAVAAGTLSGLWSKRVGRSVVVAPALAPGRVFTVSTDGRVQCLRLADGKRLWGRRIKDAGEAAPAFSSLDGETRLFVSSGELGKDLVALDAQDGRPVWNHRLDASITAIAAQESTVIALARKGLVSAWRVGDGAARWEFSLSGWDPPPFVLGQGTLFAAAQRDSVIAVDLGTGRTLWRASPGGLFVAGPVLVDSMLAVAEAGGAIAWLDLRTGAVLGRTRRSASQLTRGFGGDGHLVTVSSGGRAERAGLRPGADDWSTVLETAVAAPPLVRGASILIGSTAGGLSALDARSGELIWSFQSAGGFRTGPVAAGDTLLLADLRGHIHVYLDGLGRN